MIDIVKRRTDIGNGLQIIKSNDNLLSFLLTLDNDLLISVRDATNPAVFNVNLSDEVLYLVIDKLYNIIQENAKQNNNSLLFHDNMIDYHSDECDYNVASRLIIMRNNHDYNIMVLENKLEDTNNTVIIANKSMRYSDNQPFFEFYNNLNNYDLKTKKLIK